jgi:hypothetical protein
MSIGEAGMNDHDVITRHIHGATVSVPVGVALTAFLAQALGSVGKSLHDIPPIGARWKGQGGFNGGLGREKDGRPYWLITADPAKAIIKSTYGGYGKDESGAKCEFDGRANTLALCNSEIDHPAAQYCAQYECEGHKDYHLASKRENAVLYASVAELFPKEWILGSTQDSALNAWAQVFGDGVQYGFYESNEGCVVPVRKINYSLI